MRSNFLKLLCPGEGPVGAAPAVYPPLGKGEKLFFGRQHERIGRPVRSFTTGYANSQPLPGEGHGLMPGKVAETLDNNHALGPGL